MTARRLRLAHRRKAVGLTQEELAERIGVDPATVRRWEAGVTAPRPWLRRSTVPVRLCGDHQAASVRLLDAVRQLEAGDATHNIRLAAEVDLSSALARGADLAHGCELLAETYGELCAAGNSRGIERAHYARRRMHSLAKEPVIARLDERMSEVAGGRN